MRTAAKKPKLRLQILLPGLGLALAAGAASAPAARASEPENPVCRAIEPVLAAEFENRRREWLLEDEAASQVAWSANTFAAKLGGDDLLLLREYFEHGRDERLGVAISRRASAVVDQLKAPGGIDAIRCPEGYAPEPNALPGDTPGLSRCVKQGSRLGGGLVVTTAPTFSIHTDQEAYITLSAPPLWDREITLTDTAHVDLPPERIGVRLCASLHPGGAAGAELCHVVRLAELVGYRRLSASDVLVESRRPAAFANTLGYYLAGEPRWRELGCHVPAITREAVSSESERTGAEEGTFAAGAGASAPGSGLAGLGDMRSSP